MHKVLHLAAGRRVVQPRPAVVELARVLRGDRQRVVVEFQKAVAARADVEFPHREKPALLRLHLVVVRRVGVVRVPRLHRVDEQGKRLLRVVAVALRRLSLARAAAVLLRGPDVPHCEKAQPPLLRAVPRHAVQLLPHLVPVLLHPVRPHLLERDTPLQAAHLPVVRLLRLALPGGVVLARLDRHGARPRQMVVGVVAQPLPQLVRPLVFVARVLGAAVRLLQPHLYPVVLVAPDGLLRRPPQRVGHRLKQKVPINAVVLMWEYITRLNVVAQLPHITR